MGHRDRHVIAIQRPFTDLAALACWAMKDEKLAFALVHLQAHLGTAIEAVLDNRGHLELLQWIPPDAPHLRRTGESSGVTASDGSYALTALALGFPHIAFNLNTAVVVGDHVAPRLSAARWPAE